MTKIDQLKKYKDEGLLTEEEFKRLAFWSASQQLKEINRKMEKLWGNKKYIYNPNPTDFSENL